MSAVVTSQRRRTWKDVVASRCVYSTFAQRIIVGLHRRSALAETEVQLGEFALQLA
jgi:hypothetical protein